MRDEKPYDDLTNLWVKFYTSIVKNCPPYFKYPNT